MADGSGPGPGGSVLIFELELISFKAPSDIPLIGPIIDTIDVKNPTHIMIFLYIIYKVYSIMSGGVSGAAGKAKKLGYKDYDGKPENVKVFFDVKIGDREPERIEFELFK